MTVRGQALTDYANEVLDEAIPLRRRAIRIAPLLARSTLED